MRVTFLESPEGLLPESTEWENLKQAIREQQPEILVTNEMPFGPWLAVSDQFDDVQARESVQLHQQGMSALNDLNVPVVLSSRPVFCHQSALNKNRLVNEAFALIRGKYCVAHHKHYFPDEPGFNERPWFSTEKTGFDVVNTPGLSIGILLCTEVMFSEWARAYRRQGAQLIVVPRATEPYIEKWKTAASMAAIVSGCYVVSSNRVGTLNSQFQFGGQGFAFAPDGSQIAETSRQQPVMTIELDTDWVMKQQKCYPCYIPEWEQDNRD